MSENQNAIKLFTLGFAQKSAEQFFKILKAAGVKKLIDIRLNNESQLAGFTKMKDLKYFLKEICEIAYEYRPEFAPTKDILNAYKKKEMSWQEYEVKYNRLLEERDAYALICPEELNMACFLCSEPKADACHRRLLAEYFNMKFKELEIVHL